MVFGVFVEDGMVTLHAGIVRNITRLGGSDNRVQKELNKKIKWNEKIKNSNIAKQ